MRYLIIYLAAVNAAAFALCVCDKRAAVRGRRRISERVLLTVALIGGAVGLYAGMLAVRHKTRKVRFAVLVPVIIAVQVVALVLLLIPM